MHRGVAQQSRQAARLSIAEKEATLTTGLKVVLCRQPRIAALEHVVLALDELVDVSWQWNIARACAFENEATRDGDGGAHRLVLRIVARRPLALMDNFYRQAQLSAGLVNATNRGNLELVRRILEYTSWDRACVDRHSGVFKAAEAAAAMGRTDILQYLLRYDRPSVSVKSAMLCAARANKTNVLTWLYERLVVSTDLKEIAGLLLEAAAGNGNVEMARWLADTVGIECMHSSATRAAQNALSNCHLDMVKRLFAVAPSNCGLLSLDEAAGCGFLQAVVWGHENGGECTVRAMDAAAGSGHLGVVQWLHHNRAEGCTTKAMDDAASRGHLSVVRWLHSKRSEGCTTQAMDGAASSGHLDIVRWLHHNRSEGCTVTAMDEAASKDHLGVVQWLHEHRAEGCTQSALDKCNSVAMMEWLVHHRPGDCWFSPEALANVAANGKLRAVEWLYNNYPPTDEWIACEAMDRAASAGHLDVVLWLHERHPQVGGCTSAAMDGAAFHGHLRVVEWLHWNRQEGASYRAMDGAAAGGHLDVLLFLSSHRRDGCTSDAAVKAALNEHTEVVQWILHHYPQQIYNERVRKFAARYNFSLIDRFHRNHLIPVVAY